MLFYVCILQRCLFVSFRYDANGNVIELGRLATGRMNHGSVFATHPKRPSHFSILLMYLSCLRSGALCIQGEVQLFSLLLEVMMEPRSWPPQRFKENSFVFTIWTKLVWLIQALNLNDGTWKCGGDMNIRRQGVRGLIFQEKKNSRRIVKEAWKRHLFGQLTWQGRAQYF